MNPLEIRTLVALPEMRAAFQQRGLPCTTFETSSAQGIEIEQILSVCFSRLAAVVCVPAHIYFDIYIYSFKFSLYVYTARFPARGSDVGFLLVITLLFYICFEVTPLKPLQITIMIKGRP